MSSLPAVRRGLGVPPARGAEGLSVDAISRPARTFTGDFYFAHRRDDRVWLALGDVAGKGLPAAIVMAMIQEELEERIVLSAETRCDPALTIAGLHDFLLPLMPQNRFATGVIAHLRDDGLLTYTNAGHCPPLLVRANGEIEELSSTGPIMGLLPHAKWQSRTAMLEDGDRLVLYSDGVIEATRGEEELGVCGLRAIVRKTETARGIMSALREYEHGDDTTVVVITRE